MTRAAMDGSARTRKRGAPQGARMATHEKAQANEPPADDVTRTRALEKGLHIPETEDELISAQQGRKEKAQQL